MVVENLKLHSNYLHPNCTMDEGTEGRINKLRLKDSLGGKSMISHDMCFLTNNKYLNKTIATNMSNGLSFKGRDYKKLIDNAYKTARAMVDEKMPERAKHLARKAGLERIAKQIEKEHPLICKIVGNKHFQKAMKFMNDNALLSDATIALLYTCVMRPASIAALPTKDNREKKKNIYQIGHSISTGIIGFITAFAIQTPIKTAIDKIIKNVDKYVKNSGKKHFKKENVEKIRCILERSHQPISLPLKAALTIYLVPKILKTFGLTKDLNNKDKNKTLPYDAFRYFAAFKGSNNSVFQSFAGGLKDASK